jgi:hypothetical protein
MFKSKVEVLSLGLFQLENLAAQRVPHLLINIAKKQPAKSAMPAPFAQAVSLEESEVEGHLCQSAHDSLTPVILVCENGQRSLRLAERMTAKFPSLNILFVEGGIETYCP